MESLFLNRSFVIATASALGVSLAACGGGGELGDRIGTSDPSVRFVNAVPGSTLSLYRNGADNGLGLNNVQYSAITKFSHFDDETSTFSVRSNNVEVGTAGSVNAAKGHRYLTVAFPVAGASNITAGAIDLKLLDDPYNRRASVVPTVRLVHATPGNQPVDVYITAPDQALGTPSAPNFAYQSFWPASGSDAQKLDDTKGKFRVRVTSAGNSADILFDSQEIDLDANADEVIALVPAQGQALGSPIPATLKRGDISLVLNDGNSNDKASRVITDRP
jgi:hypothetical protein